MACGLLRNVGFAEFVGVVMNPRGQGSYEDRGPTGEGRGAIGGLTIRVDDPYEQTVWAVDPRRLLALVLDDPPPRVM